MQDYEDAQHFRWLGENPDAVVYVTAGKWAVWTPHDLLDAPEPWVTVVGLGKAIELAKMLGPWKPPLKGKRARKR
jgi:hypothetical protein